MKFVYFKASHLTSIEDAKRQYKHLVFTYHPDVACAKGTMDYEEANEAMKTINAEWDYLRKHNYNVHESADGSIYTDWTQDTPDDVTNMFVEIIEQLIRMDGLEIEVCGSWLWVGGNTREHKDDLKAMGMRWAPKKHLWYKAPKSWKRNHRGEFTMDEIRSRYGSQSVGKPRVKALKD